MYAAQYDQYGNPIFAVPQQIQQPASGAQPDYSQQYYAPQQPYGQPLQGAAPVMAPSSSIGSLPPMAATSGAPTNITAPTMSKTDSHAVLMELFARDQDLVRQANNRIGQDEEGELCQALTRITHNQVLLASNR